MNRKIETYINNNDNYNEVSLTLLIWGSSIFFTFQFVIRLYNGRYVMYNIKCVLFTSNKISKKSNYKLYNEFL